MGATHALTLGSPVASARRLREVLIVEDDDSIRETQIALLEHAGYAVRQAPDGVQALEVLEQGVPDLIVLDMMLPRLSGWQFLERSRKLADRAQVPVMIVSALDPHIDAMATLEVAAWLTKPVGAERFLRTVGELVGPPLPRVLVVDDERTIRELLVEHLAEEGFAVQSAATIELARACIGRWRPDAMVLDLMLPGRTGWDFLRQRATDAALSRVAVVVISAATQARLEEAGQLGADALLGKPFDLNEITALLHSFVA